MITETKNIVFNDRLDSIFLSLGFYRNAPSIGKGITFDYPMSVDSYERRIRAYYDGPQGYGFTNQRITIFCMDRPIQKIYDYEDDITEDQIKAFITLCK